MEAVYSRFERWFAWTGGRQKEVAERLGCHQSEVSKLLSRKRGAGLRLAQSIERETVEWPSGPIRASEWIPKNGGRP